MQETSLETRILLVDEQTMIREGLRNMFQYQAGMKVIGEAGNIGQANDLARDLSPDIVIMGVSGPDPGSIACIRRIVEGMPGTRVIVILRNLRRDLMEEILRSGASAYLAHDSPYDEVGRAVQTVLRGQTYITPVIASLVINGYITQQTGQSVNNGLTDREVEVLRGICEGRSTRDIAGLLDVSVKTVETHRRRMMEKLRIDNVVELIKFAIREGITTV